MNIILKNGESMQVQEESTCMQAAAAISEGLARNAVCAKVNGEEADLSRVLKEGDTLEIITLKDKEGLRLKPSIPPANSRSVPSSKTGFITTSIS